MIFRTPEDFKKSKFIMGKYRVQDLAILLFGVTTAFLLVIVIFSNDLIVNPTLRIIALIAIAIVGLLSAVLTLPFAGYHNVLIHLKILFYFHSKYIKRYIWSGHDYRDFIE